MVLRIDNRHMHVERPGTLCGGIWDTLQVKRGSALVSQWCFAHTVNQRSYLSCLAALPSRRLPDSLRALAQRALAALSVLICNRCVGGIVGMERAFGLGEETNKERNYQISNRILKTCKIPPPAPKEPLDPCKPLLLC